MFFSPSSFDSILVLSVLQTLDFQEKHCGNSSKIYWNNIYYNQIKYQVFYISTSILNFSFLLFVAQKMINFAYKFALILLINFGIFQKCLLSSYDDCLFIFFSCFSLFIMVFDCNGQNCILFYCLCLYQIFCTFSVTSFLGICGHLLNQDGYKIKLDYSQ